MAKKIIGRVQFYAPDQTGRRRIFSFRVNSKEAAINALVRMDIPAGWYKANEKIQSSEKIENPYFTKENNGKGFFEKFDNFLNLDN